MKLDINQVIEYLVSDEIIVQIRIIYVDPTLTDVSLIDLVETAALPYWAKYQDVCNDLSVGLARIAEKDNFTAPVFSDSELDKYPSLREKRDSARKIIEPLVTGKNGVNILFPKERAELVEEAKLLHKASRPKIYNLLRLYWKGGLTYNTLIPKYFKSGGKGKKRKYKKKPGELGSVAREYKIVTGVVMTDEWLEIILRGARYFYENLKKRTLREAYDLTLAKFCSKRNKETGELIIPDPNKGEVFSYRQFIYYYKKDVKENLRRVLTKRHGQRAFNTNFAPRTGDLRESVFGPGSLYQVDATLVDTSLLGTLILDQIIGRPTIYVVLDVFSLYIVSVAVRLESENWLGYREVLINILEDKVEFCASFGLEIQSEKWLNANFADQFMGDRGCLETKTADSLTLGIGSQLSVAGPNRPDWKAYVEQEFNLMNIVVFHGLPGAVPQAPEREQKDYRLESLFTFEDFMQIVIKMVIFFNTQFRLKNYKMDADMIADRVEPYPHDLYLWGCENRSVPTRRHSLEEVKAHLLPDEEGTVTEFGIKFRGLYYTCEISEQEEWELKAKQLKNWTVIIAYHPRQVEPVYLRFADGSPLQPCYLKNPNSPFKNCEWSEVKEYFRIKNLQNQMASGRSRQSLSDLREDVAEITQKAKKRRATYAKEIPKQSNPQRLRSIGANKKNEIEYQNLRETAQIEELSSNSTQSQTSPSNFEHIKAIQPVNLQELKERRLRKNEK